MAQMDGNEKDAIRDLLNEWLQRFGVSPIDAFEDKIVREGLNFVLDNNYHPGAVRFEGSTFFDWRSQELIAFIAEFFVQMRGAMSERHGVEDRILQLKSLVQEHNIPRALLTV